MKLFKIAIDNNSKEISTSSESWFIEKNIVLNHSQCSMCLVLSSLPLSSLLLISCPPSLSLPHLLVPNLPLSVAAVPRLWSHPPLLHCHPHPNVKESPYLSEHQSPCVWWSWDLPQSCHMRSKWDHSCGNRKCTCRVGCSGCAPLVPKHLHWLRSSPVSVPNSPSPLKQTRLLLLPCLPQYISPGTTHTSGPAPQRCVLPFQLWASTGQGGFSPVEKPGQAAMLYSSAITWGPVNFPICNE